MRKWPFLGRNALQPFHGITLYALLCKGGDKIYGIVRTYKNKYDFTRQETPFGWVIQLLFSQDYSWILLGG